MKKSVPALLATLIMTFALAGPAAAQEHPVAIPDQCNGTLEGCGLNWLERNAVRVLNEHFVAFGEGDLDEVMSHYNKWSVIITQNGIVVGEDEIRDYYVALLSLFGDSPSEDSEFVVDLTRVKNGYIYYTWHAHAQAGITAPFGADTMLVAGNTFLLHTTAFIVEF